MNKDQLETIEAVREATRGVVERFSRTYFLECARNGVDTQEMWKVMGEQGLLGLGLEEEYGGSGRDLTASVAFTEALAEAGLPPVFVLANSFTRNAIHVGGNDEQRQRYIPGTVTGDQRFAFALTEPDAGTNSFNITTRARRTSNGDYLIRGQKTFTSHLDFADAMMIIAKVESLSGNDEIGIFVIDLPADGLTSQLMKINLHTPDHRFHVFLDDVEVPASNRIGGDGEGKRILFSALNPERFLIAAMCIGLGTLALDKGVAYAKTRSPFGAPIGSYQSIAHPLARAKTRLEAARLMIYEGARQYDEGGTTTGALASMAKLLAAEGANDAIDACIQTYGGAAFDEDSDVVTLWPLIRLQRIAPVTDEMILNQIAQQVLGLPKSY